MKKKVSGQITLETAIVMPVMMLIIAGLICVVLYCHDALVINAYVYGTANEHINEGFEALQTALEKTENSAPLFIIRPEKRNRGWIVFILKFRRKVRAGKTELDRL